MPVFNTPGWLLSSSTTGQAPQGACRALPATYFCFSSLLQVRRVLLEQRVQEISEQAVALHGENCKWGRGSRLSE